MRKYLLTKTQQGPVFSRDTLLEELASQQGLRPLGSAVLEQLVNAKNIKKPEWDSAQATNFLYRRFLDTLLDKAAYAWRLPHIAGHLVSNSIHWAELFPPLLKDLSSPAEISHSAELLLQQHAPNQTLLLAQQIPLDLQKQAQTQRANLEKQVSTLQAELLKIGGSADDLIEDKDLGRWPFLIEQMTNRFQVRQAEVEEKALHAQEQARQLLLEINQLEMAIFEARSDTSVQAYELVGKGLNLARSVVRQAVLFEKVNDYLEEIRYRLGHQSLEPAELQEVTEQFQKTISGEKTTPEVERSVPIVLDLLQREEIRPLGLSLGLVDHSEVATRYDLLQNWLEVRDLSSFLGEKLSSSERNKIRNLFRYFTQMTKMKRVYAPNGSPVEGNLPTVFAYWKLQFPKVSVLRDNCILIAMPGNPPTPRYLKSFGVILEDREWLNYGFVFLFAPGLTMQQRKRLQQTYKDEGLVIIDESSILDIILAEADTRIPLGRLRSMMLNAFGAQNVDVFKINQSVDSENGIFVGRDSLVRRIASSGDNYALYGGRRIGKSSILNAVAKRLRSKGTLVVLASFEGNRSYSDDSTAHILGKFLELDREVKTVDDLKTTLWTYLEKNPESQIAFLLDEIDRYIKDNQERHILIEALRALSEHYGSRFRVIVAGFMHLYDCLQGRGPYTPSSDPWRRMLNDIGPLGNLRAASAENIVKEGFLNILGWDFENRAIARWIVERTGGHPAFVQCFCLKLQQLVAKRGDRQIRLKDVEDIFAHQDPDRSFIAYVRKTLELNLASVDGIIGRYLILWMATDSSEMQGFTLDQARETVELSEVGIPEKSLLRALERLKVTSVVKERSPGVYEFSVPDYPLFLFRLGDIGHLDEVEDKLKQALGE